MQNVLSQSDCRIVNQPYLQNKSVKQRDFVHAEKVYWLGMVKNGCGQPGLWTLKLTLSDFLIAGTAIKR